MELIFHQGYEKGDEYLSPCSYPCLALCCIWCPFISLIFLISWIIEPKWAFDVRGSPDVQTMRQKFSIMLNIFSFCMSTVWVDCWTWVVENNMCQYGNTLYNVKCCTRCQSFHHPLNKGFVQENWKRCVETLFDNATPTAII